MVNKNSPDQNDIKQDSIIQRMLANLPPEISNSFTDTQLLEIKKVFMNKLRNSSGVDIRLSIPFFKRRFYLVFLMGKERRSLQSLKHSKFLIFNPLVAIIFVIFIISIILIVTPI